MIRVRATMRPVALALLCLSLVSCEAMMKPAPDKAYFAIDVPPPARAKASSDLVLRVRRVNVATPYHARTFVYKVGEGKFESDYYNGFITSPAENLTGELIEWLAAGGPFASAIDGASSVSHQLVLESNVTALYGDYTDKQAPQAVIEAKFFLMDDTGADTRIVHQKTYRQTAPLTGEGPAALVVAWGQAWRKMLTQLTEDLSRVKVPGKPPT